MRKPWRLSSTIFRSRGEPDLCTACVAWVLQLTVLHCAFKLQHYCAAFALVSPRQRPAGLRHDALPFAAHEDLRGASTLLLCKKTLKTVPHTCTALYRAGISRMSWFGVACWQQTTQETFE